MGSPLILKYFLHMLLFLLCSHATSSQYQQETDALNALKAMFNNQFLNDNWTHLQCFVENRPQWYGLTCKDGHVTGILLEGMGLTGVVTSNALFNLTELTVLSFKNNSISGNVMNFSSNQKLTNIDLSTNRFYGPISDSLLSLNLLESLQLQDNSLTGPIPGFNQTSLKVFNVSNNNLSGLIPPTQGLKPFGYASYYNNPDLCGPPSPNDCNSSRDVSAEPHKSSRPNFATMFFIFDVVGLVAVILLFVLYYKKASNLRKMMMMKEGYSKEVEDDEEEEEDKDKDKDKDESEDEEKSLKKTASGEQRVVIRDQEKGKLTFMGEGDGFELHDLLKASAEGLGKGIFGNSYKAKLEGRAAVVVKRIRDLKPLSVEGFTRQLQMIADQKHPNLLPLLAYYYSTEEKLLVYKYAENGNLFNRIHGGRGGERIPFRWSSRLSVARGVARALEYLHINANSNSQNTVPHGNLKPSNVLLDENEMALVSDYGLTSLIALPVAAQRLVSYKSPEYQAAKKVSKKSDIWSYGCLILELLTGRISVHSAPPGINGVDLCSWVHRAVREEWTAEIFDNEITVQSSPAPGALKLLQIAIRCCDKYPEKRPEMTEVVREVENIKIIEYSDESDFSVDQSLTDESLSATASVIIGDER